VKGTNSNYLNVLRKTTWINQQSVGFPLNFEPFQRLINKVTLLLMQWAGIAQTVKWFVTEWKTGVRFLVGVKFSVFTIMSRPAVGLTQPRIQRVPGLKQPELEADRSLATSGDVRMYTILPERPVLAFMTWCSGTDEADFLPCYCAVKQVTVFSIHFCVSCGTPLAWASRLLHWVPQVSVRCHFELKLVFTYFKIVPDVP
jgi:hypothetical protein